MVPQITKQYPFTPVKETTRKYMILKLQRKEGKKYGGKTITNEEVVGEMGISEDVSQLFYGFYQYSRHFSKIYFYLLQRLDERI